jgi:hypothetical protein
MMFEAATSYEDFATLCRLSKACRTWRYIILATPLLWSKVLCLDTCNEWADELLKRTKHVPLHIGVKCADLMQARTFRIISNLVTTAKHFWHVSSFDVEAPSEHLMDFLQDAFDNMEVMINEAAYLRRLVI